MKKILTVFITASISLSAWTGELKSTNKTNPVITPDLMLFLHNTTGISGTEKVNKFEITRMFIGLKVAVGKNVLFRGTMDASTTTNLPFKKTMHLRYAYAEVKNILPLGKLVFGQQDTGLLAWQHKTLWKHRDIAYLGATSVFDTSTDVGIAWTGGLPAGIGSFHLGLFSGESFKDELEETDPAKAFSLRLTFSPFKSAALRRLMLTVYGKKWMQTDTKAEKTVGGINIAYANSLFRLASEYFAKRTNGKTTSLLSAYGTLAILKKKLDLILRYDRLDPDTETGGDIATTFYGGIKFHFCKKTALSAVFIAGKADESADTTSQLKFVFSQKI